MAASQESLGWLAGAVAGIVPPGVVHISKGAARLLQNLSLAP